MNPKHEKHTSYEKLPDGSLKITTKAYYERLANQVEEIEKQYLSDIKTINKDVQEALKHFTDDGSPRLVLTIELKGGQPRITKKYVTLKQNFGKR